MIMARCSSIVRTAADHDASGPMSYRAPGAGSLPGTIRGPGWGGAPPCALLASLRQRPQIARQAADEFAEAHHAVCELERQTRHIVEGALKRHRGFNRV